MGHFDTRPAGDFDFESVLYEKGDSTPALEELATAFRDAAFDDRIGAGVEVGAGS